MEMFKFKKNEENKIELFAETSLTEFFLVPTIC